MTLDQFNRYRDQAVILHTSQTGESEHHVSLDAIFSAVVAHAASDTRKPAGRPTAEPEQPPAWFTDAMTRLKGQNVTASHFLLLAGQSAVTEDERRSVGRWLRSAGIHPVRRGGQQLFQL